jgi:hypothetical protein
MNKLARGPLFNYEIVCGNGDLFLLFEAEIRSCGLELSRFRVMRSEVAIKEFLILKNAIEFGW